jgi:hypothetical protein
MLYRGIIVEESLADKDVLSDVRILSVKVFDEGTPNEWHILKVQVDGREALERVADRLSRSFDLKQSWYAHFYSENSEDQTLVVVFPTRVVWTHKNNPVEAVQYGLELKIPVEQLDFRPKDVSEETY